MSITTSTGHRIVDFEIKSISGTSAIGMYVLKFSVDYSIPAHEQEVAYFHKTTAKVYVGKDNALLGFATPEVPKTFRPHNHEQKSGLLYEMALTKEVIEELEILRSGEELEFKVDIYGEYYDGDNLLCDSTSVQYKASQNEWINTLKSMNFKGGLILELPMDITPSEEIKTALIAIEKAKNHLYHGNYDDVVAKCRIALESAMSAWGDKQSIKGLSKASKKGMSKDHRFIHAIDQIVNFTHLSHHPDDDDKYISFSRSEAIFVMGATLSVISSYSEYKI